MPPTPDDKIRFLVNLQRLLDEGLFVASYKFAMLLSRADLAIEKGNDTETMFCAVVAKSHQNDTVAIEPIHLLAAIVKDRDSRLAQLLHRIPHPQSQFLSTSGA